MSEWSDVVLRAMTRSDVDHVVMLHLEAFRGFFLSRLGRSFLQVFYTACLEDGAIALVATIDDRLAGFAMGSESPRGFYRRILKRRGVRLAITAAGAVVREPSLAIRVMRAFLLAGSAHRSGESTLMSIAVAPTLQNRGIGSRLVAAFIESAGGRGASSVNLLTERDGNEATNAFYARLGFNLVREVAAGRGPVMNEYEVGIPKR